MLECKKCVNHSGCEVQRNAIDCEMFSLRMGRRKPEEFCRGCVHRVMGQANCRKYDTTLETEMDLMWTMCLRVFQCVKEDGWKLS